MVSLIFACNNQLIVQQKKAIFFDVRKQRLFIYFYTESFVCSLILIKKKKNYFKLLHDFN